MSLPSGLCVYESKFRDVYGATLCFGGPHEVFTQSYKAAGFDVTNGTVQVLLNEIASAYQNAPRTFITNPPAPASDGASPVDALPGLVADNTDPQVVDAPMQTPEEDFPEPVASNVATPVNVPPSDVQVTSVPDLQSIDAPIQASEKDFPGPVAGDTVTPDSTLLPDDQETSILDSQDIDAHEQTPSAPPLVLSTDGAIDVEGLTEESDPGAPILGLGNESSCSNSTGEMLIDDGNEAHVADPPADDSELEVVAYLDQPQEGSPSAHAIEVAQSPADLPSSGESSLGAAVEELQGECHVKPDHCPERPPDEQQQVEMATASTVLMHREQHTTLDNTGDNRAVDMTSCSVQTDTVPPTDHKAKGGSCPGHPIVASQSKEIEDLKKQIVRLEGALMRAAVNCNAEAKAVKSKTKTELAELRRRVHDQEDMIEELWDRVAKGMIGPPKIHAESQTRKDDVAEVAATPGSVDTGGRTVEAQFRDTQHQTSKSRNAKRRRNKAAWRKAEAAARATTAANEQPLPTDVDDPAPSLGVSLSNIPTANSALPAEQHAPTTRGPRWACPVNDHAEHMLAQCVDFWGAADCVSRRQLLSQAGCVTCLGRDQGCKDGICAITIEVPGDTVCPDCMSIAGVTTTPPSWMCCDEIGHRKPVTEDLIEVMEAWIPGLRTAELGVTINVPVRYYDESIPPQFGRLTTEMKPKRKGRWRRSKANKLQHPSDGITSGTGPGGSISHIGLDSLEHVPGQFRKTAPDDPMLLDPGDGRPSTREVQAFPSEQNGGGPTPSKLFVTLRTSYQTLPPVRGWRL
jgi:hypothetical protein